MQETLQERYRHAQQSHSSHLGIAHFPDPAGQLHLNPAQSRRTSPTSPLLATTAPSLPHTPYLRHHGLYRLTLPPPPPASHPEWSHLRHKHLNLGSSTASTACVPEPAEPPAAGFGTCRMLLLHFITLAPNQASHVSLSRARALGRWRGVLAGQCFVCRSCLDAATWDRDWNSRCCIFSGAGLCRWRRSDECWCSTWFNRLVGAGRWGRRYVYGLLEGR